MYAPLAPQLPVEKKPLPFLLSVNVPVDNPSRFKLYTS